MVRIAFLEYEKETKDIIFQLAKMFSQTDWTFRHYWKASELAKAMKKESYQIFVFDEMFKTPRLESVFVHDNPNSIFIYVCSDVEQIKAGDQRERIIYISKDHLLEDLEANKKMIMSQSLQNDVYTFSYNSVHVNLPYEDIYYLEKIEKMVYFYTKKGIFKKRINMSELESIFEPYGFLRVHVSFLVNAKHVVAWNKDEVEIVGGTRIPVSRQQRRKILSNKKAAE